MWNKFILYLNTIKYLKFTQAYYRGFYFLKNRIGANSLVCHNTAKKGLLLKLKPSIDSPHSYTNNKFTFLNKSQNFNRTSEINWNFIEYGKLWCYNLNYFDFLHQPDLTKQEGLQLILNYINKKSILKDGIEPYPISLRNINWIKYIIKYGIKNEQIDKFIYSGTKHLMKNLEFHLLGNHILENAFSLLFCAYYFQDNDIFQRAEELLKKELTEQIFSDGAHFELSPMYHQIMLSRLLDCINLLQNNSWKDGNLLSFLTQKSSKMLGWLSIITFRDCSIPHVNDSTNNIAPGTKSIFDYAQRLKIEWSPSKLKDSGYRKFANEKYEILIDVGKIGPDYIPAHSHSDIFNFILYINENPVIVDPGISTYEKNELRNIQRSTLSHNTVVINNQEQNDIWGGFRVGKRVRRVQLEENNNIIIAKHDGYRQFNITHMREWDFNDCFIRIKDKVIGWGKKTTATAYFHIHPEASFTLNENKLIFNNCQILIEDSLKINLENYIFCDGFNQHRNATCVAVDFEKYLTTEINITSN